MSSCKNKGRNLTFLSDQWTQERLPHTSQGQNWNQRWRPQTMVGRQPPPQPQSLHLYCVYCEFRMLEVLLYKMFVSTCRMHKNRFRFSEPYFILKRLKLFQYDEYQVLQTSTQLRLCASWETISLDYIQLNNSRETFIPNLHPSICHNPTQLNPKLGRAYFP